jgi:hypothetical protein
MADAVIVEASADGSQPSLTGISWTAVVAGAVVSCALTVLLLAFGAGLGLSVVSPWEGSGLSATSFKIGTGLYFVVMAMLSSSIGGYLAGRLRTGWTGVRTSEVYFRDTAHGFVAWGLATVLGLALLASPVGHITNGVTTVASAGANNQVSSPFDGYVDLLLRSEPTSPQTAATGTDPRPELTRLFARSIRDGGDVAATDRSYISRIVAARTGLSQADADKRVNDVVAQAKADADAARKATASLTYWLSASLLIGAFCASLAATEGGAIRDGTWRKASRT